MGIVGMYMYMHVCAYVSLHLDNIADVCVRFSSTCAGVCAYV